MSSRGKEFPKKTQDGMLSTSSAEPMQSDAIILADDLSRADDAIKWPRVPEICDLGKIAEYVLLAGYYCLGDFMGTSISGRAQSYKVSADERPSWSRATRKLPDSKAPPTETHPKKSPSFREMDIHSAAQSIRALKGIQHILRPRQEAANMFSEARHEGLSAVHPFREP